MSLKTTAFSLSLQNPKTLDKFWVMINDSKKTMFRVSSTSLPFKNRTKGAIWFLGRPYYVPTSSQVSDNWSCIIEEDQMLSLGSYITFYENLIRVDSFAPIEIFIAVTDQLTGEIPQAWCILKGAWLQSVEALQLDWSKPTEGIRYRLTFCYSDLIREGF